MRGMGRSCARNFCGANGERARKTSRVPHRINRSAGRAQAGNAVANTDTHTHMESAQGESRQAGRQAGRDGLGRAEGSA